MKSVNFKKIAVVLVIFLLSIFFLHNLSIFMPILLAWLTAILLEPLIQWLQKYIKSDNRIYSVGIVFTGYLAIISGSVYIAATQLIKQAIKWIYQFPHYAIQMQDFMEHFLDDFHLLIVDIPQNHLLIQEMERQAQWVTDKAIHMAQNVIPVLTAWIQSVPSFIVVTFVYLLAFFLFSLDMPRISQAFYRFFQDESANKLRYVFGKLQKVMTGFLKAQLFISSITFIVTYVCLLFLIPKQALLIAVIVWFIDLIPFVASGIVLVPWIIYLYFVGNTVLALKLIILVGVLFILRRMVEPKIMGDQIGLPALPTLLSIYFGLCFMGLKGLILGPILVIAVKSAAEAGMFNTDFKIF